jgi:phage terminase large subunit GpA-like protein
MYLTIGADVQGDRVEAEVVAWGPRRESWSITYIVLPGEPTAGEVWDDLLELYRTEYTAADGRKLKAIAMCVDSGAYTQHVYEFCKRARDRGIVPIKGASGMTRDQIDGDERQRRKRIARRMRAGRPPEIIGVDSVKRTLFHDLSAPIGAPGYCHFPTGRGEEYYLQLTGERLITVSHRGKRPERRWVPIHAAVEALDCRCYAYAALLLSGVRLDEPVVRLASDPAAEPTEERVRDERFVRGRRNYVQNWRP